MQGKTFRTNTFMLEACKNFTNISINRRGDYILFVRTVSTPKQCKMLTWESTACWFSHVLATRISSYIKDGELFETAYKKAIMRMRRDLVANNYTESEIRYIRFNIVCVKLNNGNAVIFKNGDDYCSISLGTTEIRYDDTASLALDSNLADPIFVKNLQSISIASEPFADFCMREMTFHRDLSSMHKLSDEDLRKLIGDYRKLDVDAAYISSRVS